jgi:hypothetical protein
MVRSTLTLGLLFGFVSSAHAVVFTFFGGPDQSKLSLTQPGSTVTGLRNDFLTGFSSYGVEDLEDNGGQTNPTLSFPGTGLTATTGFANGVNSQFAYAVSGLNFLWDTEGVADWILFSTPITMFGAYVVQGGDGASAPPTSTPPNELRFRLENTLLGTSKDVFVRSFGPDWPFYNVTFVGVKDTDSFNKISFLESYDRDGLLWDDLIAGYSLPAPEASVWPLHAVASQTAAVPEPGTCVLFASALAIGLISRLGNPAYLRRVRRAR